MDPEVPLTIVPLAAALVVLLLLGAVLWRIGRLGARIEGISGISARLDEAAAREGRAERALLGELATARRESGGDARALRAELGTRIDGLAQVQRDELGRVRETLDRHLERLSRETAERLDRVQRAVDQELGGLLERRLGESFRQVSERLADVQRGLGEMQSLAAGVGDLRRVLGNVKARGVLGEVQLGALLDEVLAPEQLARNVAVTGGAERVEFAVRLPGTGDGEVLLPIDAKFPQEDYQRLVDAADRADADGVREAGRALEQRVRDEARKISAKYVSPPRTTDFAVLFLPTEGLFAELLRRPGLPDSLLREHRIVIAGPTTLCALLGSLQMGFRTLAIQRRSGEVWSLLGEVKTAFGRYAGTLDQVRRKLDQATTTVDQAATRTRAIERRLREVEAVGEGEIPEAEAEAGHEHEHEHELQGVSADRGKRAACVRSS